MSTNIPSHSSSLPVPGPSEPGGIRGSLGRTIASIAGAFLLAAVLVTPSFWAFSRIQEAAGTRTHIHDVIGRSNAFLGALRDAETGQRGYLLTGNETFLEPYLAVRAGLEGQLQDLRSRTRFGPARAHLEAVAPLLQAKLTELDCAIDLRRRQDTTGALAVVRTGLGKRLMDSIRVEMASYTQVEMGLQGDMEADFHARMSRLFTVIVSVGLLTLLGALALVSLIQRQARQRLRDLVHLETRHLLEVQEDMNTRLQQANLTLQEREEQLTVTLRSIGDAVITTDAEARVRLLNPVAEQLTGFTQAQAEGRPVNEVFHILNQETRQPSIVPVMETLAKGTLQGLANHTILIAQDGSEASIADSCAPILNREGQVSGAVLVFRDVSDEYAAQQALRDSAALIRTILNTVVDGIVTFHVEGGYISNANPAAERIFGYPAPELIGLPFGKLVPEFELGDAEHLLEQYSAGPEALAKGLGREVLGRRRDGTTFPMEIAVSDMWLGGQRYFTGLLRDITARKLAEEAALQAGALQAAIFNSANFSSIATDAKGVIQIFNVGAEHMLGYQAADVMNRITPADISDPLEVIERAETLSRELGTTIAPGFEALVFKASRGIEDIYELTYIRKNGSRFPALVSVTALRDARGAIIGFLLIGIDNSARKRVEAERERLDRVLVDKNAELEGAKSAAEKANRAKSEFLSSMSHELRSPLNAILGFAQLMDSDAPPPSPAQKASLDQILHAGWYLLELVNEILDLAAIESGKLSLSPEPVALDEVLLDCQAMIQPQAQKRNLKVVFPRADLPVFVQADRIRLKQVLINLLSNAIRYNTPGGTVIVTCAPGRPGRSRISVRDTGHGLSADKLRQLFQPFNRLGQENSVEDGTGIGLVMSKLLVELMGGDIGVESRVGEGSVFWFELNTAIPGSLPAELPEPLTATLPAAMPDSPLRTLLYVEDNPANLSLVEQLIARRRDLHLLSAVNGRLGLDIARERRPDVILLDINLPGLNGFEVLELLRQDPLTAHIPVVAISANAMLGDITRGLEAGFFRYLTKPINVQEFLETMDTVLAFARHEADSRA